MYGNKQDARTREKGDSKIRESLAKELTRLLVMIMLMNLIIKLSKLDFEAYARA